MSRKRSWPASLASSLLLWSCGTATESLSVAHQADRFAAAEWSDPVNLGPIVNSSDADNAAALSPDEHTLYFLSNRPGGLGGNDICASHRRCKTCEWETPYNLGTPINSAAAEGAPTLSEDGRMLFFFTTRADSVGLADIYVSHRVSAGTNGDVWGEPVNLGPDVNTAVTENGSYYTREGGVGTATLYFNRLTAGNLDIYKAELSNDGVPLGPAVAVSELNDPAATDQKVTVRTDGLELLISSNRAGSFGNLDIWRSTRQTVQDPWSTPAHIGPPLNTAGIDSQPSLSRDGQTLIFTSSRSGGFGNTDLWMSTRRPGNR